MHSQIDAFNSEELHRFTQLFIWYHINPYIVHITYLLTYSTSLWFSLAFKTRLWSSFQAQGQGTGRSAARTSHPRGSKRVSSCAKWIQLWIWMNLVISTGRFRKQLKSLNESPLYWYSLWWFTNRIAFLCTRASDRLLWKSPPMCSPFSDYCRIYGVLSSLVVDSSMFPQGYPLNCVNGVGNCQFNTHVTCVTHCGK